MGALVSLQGRLGGVGFNSRGPKSLKQTIQVADPESRMCLARRPEICLHAEMELDILRLQPDPAPPGKLCRFGDFGETQNIDVERTRLGFLSLRHGNLDVVDGMDGHADLRLKRLARVDPGFKPAENGSDFCITVL